MSEAEAFEFSRALRTLTQKPYLMDPALEHI